MTQPNFGKGVERVGEALAETVPLVNGLVGAVHEAWDGGAEDQLVPTLMIIALTKADNSKEALTGALVTAVMELARERYRKQ